MGEPCLILWDRKGSLFPFKKIMKFANDLVCSYIQLFFLFFVVAETLCGSPFKVTVILAALF